MAERHKEYLGVIRHWVNLRMAVHGGEVYVRDFTQAQLDSVEVKSIPYKKLYTVHDHKLFPYGSSLPEQRMPSTLLWSPMDRVLAVTRPRFNPNYFGTGQELSITVVPSHQEQEAVAVLLPLKALGEYLATAPTVRLKTLSWIILGKQALVYGTPLLPLPGEVLWANNDFLVPAGYNFDLPVLAPTFNRLLNPQHGFWVLWNTENRYVLLDKTQFRPLSLGSFRLSERFSFTEPHAQD